LSRIVAQGLREKKKEGEGKIVKREKKNPCRGEQLRKTTRCSAAIKRRKGGIPGNARVERKAKTCSEGKGRKRPLRDVSRRRKKAPFRDARGGRWVIKGESFSYNRRSGRISISRKKTAYFNPEGEKEEKREEMRKSLLFEGGIRNRSRGKKEKRGLR